MNLQRLKESEEIFFMRYPQGFDTPEIIEIGKKHRMDKYIVLAHEAFDKKEFKKTDEVIENMIKLVSRSSMVSLFEKPKFRDSVRSMGMDTKKDLAQSLYELLHGDEEKGFNQMLDILTGYKLAKWTLITVFRCYYYPDTDMLFKPTTVKGIIKKYELEDLVYKPRPSYDFFVRYRAIINEMKKEVHKDLSPNNATFSGFLMMTLDDSM